MLTRFVAGVVGLLLVVGLPGCNGDAPARPAAGRAFDLPPAPTSGSITLEEALASRRSVREYRETPLDLDTIGRLFWAAQGRTQAGGAGRAAPSAGGTYPLEIYVATSDGLLRYLPDGHRAEWLTRSDLRPGLHRAALDQRSVLEAPAVFVIGGIPTRTESRYGERAERYVFLEAGHAAQNLLLQATALDLGAVPIGAFRDDEVSRVLGLAEGEHPIYLIPVGHPAG
ncbi:MAG: SagB/ThcOx family dehydrogenase [Acidimicrobiia bacterium]